LLVYFGRRRLRRIGSGLTQGQMISTQLVSPCLAITWLSRALESLECSADVIVCWGPEAGVVGEGSWPEYSGLGRRSTGGWWPAVDIAGKPISE